MPLNDTDRRILSRIWEKAFDFALMQAVTLGFTPEQTAESYIAFLREKIDSVKETEGVAR